MNLVSTIFWLSVGLVAYAYAGYPLLVWIVSRRRPDAGGDDAAEASAGDRNAWPCVSLVLSAYKEEQFILERLQNAVSIDYPPDRLEILVGCDGNEDCTGSLVEAFGDPRVRLLQFPQRRGKASVLNDCIPAARGDIVVLSDANTMMHPQAIRRLVRHFSTPEVGGVCGKLVLTDPVTGANADGLYWRYENFLKRCEARLGGLLGANGGIYAIRRGLYVPIPANTMNDDFLIGMRIHQQRLRLLYDESALAYEETPHTIHAEFHRRARIGAGGFQSLTWLGSLLHPRYGWVALTFLSHKVLRWICPMLLISALLSNLWLSVDPLYGKLLLAQAAFYLASLGGLWPAANRYWPRPLRLPGMFVSMNLALLVGFWRWLSGIQSGTWKRTERRVPVK